MKSTNNIKFDFDKNELNIKFPDGFNVISYECPNPLCKEKWMHDYTGFLKNDSFLKHELCCPECGAEVDIEIKSKWNVEKDRNIETVRQETNLLSFRIYGDIYQVFIDDSVIYFGRENKNGDIEMFRFDEIFKDKE